jgi:4-hydroxybenzoate polyprenyltransferase
MNRSAQAPADAVAAHWFAALPPRVKPYAQLMRLDRPIGGWLLFWPCLFGLVLGAMADERIFNEWRDFYYVILFGLGTIVMRGAGCAFNDIVDRKIDAQVARTRGRPIPSGAVTVRQAAGFVVALCLIGLVILLQFNWFSVFLGAASLLLVLAYPFMKRITWWPQAWLGLTFNWGALLGFAAETGRLDMSDGLLYAGLFFWTLGYDTIYAHQDKEDDALIGVKSTARLFGARSRQWLWGFAVLTMVLASAAIVTTPATGVWPPLVALAGVWGFGWHLAWQMRRLDLEDPTSCMVIFRANRDAGLALALFLAAAAFL